MKRSIVATALMVAVCVSTARAGDWPRYLGPNANGVVETGEKIERAWPQSGPKELWRVQTGEGFGGASIVGGKVFLLDRRGVDQDEFRVLDLNTGNKLWEYAYPAQVRRGSYPGSRSTPTVDGDFVYTVGVRGDLYCFDIANKKVAWRKSLTADLGAQMSPWGFAQSPTVLRDMLLVSVAGGGNGVVALDKKTGEPLWKSKSFGAADGYNSPLVLTIAEKEQIIMWHRGVLASIDSANGEILWSYEWRTNRVIPQPLYLGDGKFFLTVGYGGGSTILNVSKTAAAWKVTEVLQDDFTGSKVPTPLFYKGHIYTNSNDNQRGLQCLDMDGNIKWETQRRPAFGLGGMILVDGVIFIVNGDTGELVMVEATPTGYKELGRAKILGGKDIWGPLALSDGKLVLRDQSQLKCLSVGAAPTARAE